MFCDFHFHSQYSDGLFTPQELAEKLQAAHIEYAALCDHETTAGYPEMKAACDAKGIKLLHGLELNTGDEGHTHVLCYGPGVLNPTLQADLQRRKKARQERILLTLARLKEIGITLTPEHEQEVLTTGTPSRPHVARALAAEGICPNYQVAFDRYLNRGRPAYVPHQVDSTMETVALAAECGCVPVLAHPMEIGIPLEAIHALVLSLKEVGLQGMEVFHPSANTRQTRALYAMARQENLLVTGGSDFHGDPTKTAAIGRFPGDWSTEREDAERLWQAANNTLSV